MRISLLPLGITLVLLTALAFLTGCAELNDPYGRPSYGDPYYRNSYDSDYEYDRRRRNDYERREIDRERRRVEDERRRLEDERRNNQDHNHWLNNRPSQPKREVCPNGYTPSEQKCSSEERKKGCKDMRLPGGLGCVRRSFR